MLAVSCVVLLRVLAGRTWRLPQRTGPETARCLGCEISSPRSSPSPQSASTWCHFRPPRRLLAGWAGPLASRSSAILFRDNDPTGKVSTARLLAPIRCAAGRLTSSAILLAEPPPLSATIRAPLQKQLKPRVEPDRASRDTEGQFAAPPEKAALGAALDLGRPVDCFPRHLLAPPPRSPTSWLVSSIYIYMLAYLLRRWNAPAANAHSHALRPRAVPAET